MCHVSKILFANQALSSTNLWYTSCVCTININVLLLDEKSFHSFLSINYGNKKSTLGMPILIIKYTHIHVTCETYFELFEMSSFSSVTLRQHLLVTMPSLAIPLNCDLKHSFPSQWNILKVTNTYVAKDLLSFLYSWGHQLNDFNHYCGNCWLNHNRFWMFRGSHMTKFRRSYGG